MGIADFNFKLIEGVKAKIDSLKIGFNKEEKKLIIESLDQSQHVHIHNEIGLSDEAILSLPSDKIGDFLKQRAYLNLQVACKDNPKKMNEMLTLYTATAISTSTGIITATSPNLSPMPSGDFIQELPGAIESIRFVTIRDNIKIKDSIKVELVKESKKDSKN